MTAPASALRCMSDLQEAVVLQEIERRARRGDRVLHDEYRRAADLIYLRHRDPAARHDAFQALHAQMFTTLRCGRPIEEALARHGMRFQTVLVVRAWSPAEEGAEVGPDGAALGIRVGVRRFGAADLHRFLDHELGHVADMIDPAFGYGGATAAAPAARRLTGDRFGLLWDCVVDGRTAREGCEPLATQADYCARLHRLFPGLGAEDAETVVRRLWGGERPAYGDLVTFAGDPAALAAWAGVSAVRGSAAPEEAPPPVPGAPCPLCRFPTFDWARNIEEAVAALIAADFPAWSRTDGACGRCVEGYSLGAFLGKAPIAVSGSPLTLASATLCTGETRQGTTDSASEPSPLTPLKSPKTSNPSLGATRRFQRGHQAGEG